MIKIFYLDMAHLMSVGLDMCQDSMTVRTCYCGRCRRGPITQCSNHSNLLTQWLQPPQTLTWEGDSPLSSPLPTLSPTPRDPLGDVGQRNSSSPHTRSFPWNTWPDLHLNSLLRLFPFQSSSTLLWSSRPSLWLLLPTETWNSQLHRSLPKFLHVTPLFCDLHWLPVIARIRFQTLVLALQGRQSELHLPTSKH